MAYLFPQKLWTALSRHKWGSDNYTPAEMTMSDYREEQCERTL
jgi:hypothetical protein